LYSNTCMFVLAHAIATRISPRLDSPIAVGVLVLVLPLFFVPNFDHNFNSIFYCMSSKIISFDSYLNIVSNDIIFGDMH
jgi:hypothetical protein